jgi:hypothetical protein
VAVKIIDLVCCQKVRVLFLLYRFVEFNYRDSQDKVVVVIEIATIRVYKYVYKSHTIPRIVKRP